MYRTEILIKQQENTSFTADTFRDSVNYSEHQQAQVVVKLSDLESLQRSWWVLYITSRARSKVILKYQHQKIRQNIKLRICSKIISKE